MVDGARAFWTAVILLLLGAPAVVAGSADAMRGADIETRLTGAVFAVAGGLMVASAAGLVVPRWRHAWAPHLALVAGASALLLSAYLFVQQLDYREGVRSLLPFVWALCAAAAVAAIVLGGGGEAHARDGDPETADHRPSTGRPRARLLAVLAALAVPAGLFFSVFQFWYGVSSGGHFRDALTLSQTLVDEGTEAHDASLHSFLADFYIKNPTGGEVLIIRTDYELFGAREGTQAGDTGQFGQRLAAERAANGAVSARFLVYGPSDLLEVGTATGEPLLIAPMAEVETQLAIGLPDSAVKQYSHLALVTTLLTSSDRLVLSDAYSPQRRNLVPCAGYDLCTVTTWHVEPPGWL